MKFAHAHAIRRLTPEHHFAQINTEPSQTQQSDKDEADINVIVAKYGIGAFPQVTEAPRYGDFSQVTDYRTAVEMIRDANDKFLEVPAEIRAQFGNDPQAFIEYAQDPANLDQMRKWKLAPPAEQPVPSPPSKTVPPTETTTQYSDEGETSRPSSPPTHRNFSTQEAHGYERNDNSTTRHTIDRTGTAHQQPTDRAGGPPRGR